MVMVCSVVALSPYSFGWDEEGNVVPRTPVTTGGPVRVLPWSDFSVPAANMTCHGVWAADALSDAHVAVRGKRPWREWVTP